MKHENPRGCDYCGATHGSPGIFHGRLARLCARCIVRNSNSRHDFCDLSEKEYAERKDAERRANMLADEPEFGIDPAAWAAARKFYDAFGFDKWGIANLAVHFENFALAAKEETK